jgi:uncharacterized membrane protein YgdD (TMEM256/DUF423 family)
MNQRAALLSAGILGATGVGLGAFGAHGLREILLERGMSTVWETAVRYQTLHAVALLGLAAYLRVKTGTGHARVGWAGCCWVAGTVIFSGSLYGLALGGPHWLGPITPLGGIALIAGWIFVIAAALAKEV